MKLSLSWLNDFVDIEEFFKEPQKLSQILTNRGLEVEDVQNKAESFRNVVVGHILEKAQHPNADRLTLCQVSTGSGVVHQIVCGAKNHKQGDRVVVALPGAILPGNFEIKLSKIRNVESQGMLCSESELGLKENSEGILILPEDAPIGKSYAEYMGFDDIIFEIKVTPNRADCLSHYGMAREIACLLDKNLKKEFSENPVSSVHSTKKKISLKVDNSELCPRYTGCFIEGVKVGPTPSWMKRRLESSGMKSINNIVDVTNYVMLELGQPLHAFDAREVKGQEIQVSLSQKGEKFQTLDKTELVLTGNELMIRDGQRAVALAGVVGGVNSGINDSTTEVFLESAFFVPETVRKTSRFFGINTESGYRFSRRVDPSMTLKALHRAALLISEIAGGTIYGDAHDSNSLKLNLENISVELSDVEERLGYKVDAKIFEKWMERIGCQLRIHGKGYEVRPPVYRGDISIKEDLIEEYARLHGYEHIPESLPVMGTAPSSHSLEYLMNLNVSQTVRSLGFHEAFHYAFVDEKGFRQFILNEGDLKKAGFSGQAAVRIKNPLSEEMNIMRQILSYGLWKTAVRNFHYGVEFGRLFELNYVFDHYQESYNQTRSLAFILWGQKKSLLDSKNESSYLFYEMKSYLEILFKSLQIKSYSYEVGSLEFLHPGQSALIRVEGRVIGFIGMIHPHLSDSEKLRVPLCMAEINLDHLLVGHPRTLKIKSIYKTPMNQRDLAFVMPEELEVGAVLLEIQKTMGETLKDIFVFDIFRGAPLGTFQKSVAIRMLIQDKMKTLTDQELQEADKKAIDAVCRKFSIHVR